MQNKFIELRDRFCEKLEKLSYKSNRACWNFYINSTAENLKIYEDSQEEYSNLYKDEKIYHEFLEIDKNKLDKHLQKQLKDLLKSFDEELNTGEEMKKLREKENEIAQKYNSYVPKIDDKEVSRVEISKILQTEIDAEIREKAFIAKIRGGDLIADDMIEFVKMRNDFAKTKGYKTFFEYKLKEDYDVEEDFLKKLIDKVYLEKKESIKNILEKKYSQLRDFFKTEDLKPYHYGLLLNSNPEKEVNEILKNQDIVDISKKMYSNMGYDIEKLESSGKLTLDLFPRKGKNTHGFCFDIEAGCDARILANLINNVTSLDTLNHELGHCIYHLGISKNLPFLDKTASSPAVTEAIAMMMGDIIKTEDVLKDFLSQDLLERFKNSHEEDEALFVSNSLLIINFEQELYNNPNCNPQILWQNLRKKYLLRDEELTNEWVTIPHYLSHPAYYQNYFRANIMKTLIYSYLKSVLGNITENKNSAKFMDKNIFAKGASINEYDLIEELTGKSFC